MSCGERQPEGEGENAGAELVDQNEVSVFAELLLDHSEWLGGFEELDLVSTEVVHELGLDEFGDSLNDFLFFGLHGFDKNSLGTF